MNHHRQLAHGFYSILLIVSIAIAGGCHSLPDQEAYSRAFLFNQHDQWHSPNGGFHTRDDTARFTNAVNGYTIVVAPSKVTQETIRELTGQRAKALFWRPNREIYIPWTRQEDILGRPMPDFYALGHEVWHHPDLAGSFHE